ncbi:hypothetical protein MIND_01166500 [Mycena indigotica]|uniref:Uncharacterized protein n=1 Tax=Mycena indigotica TaxID=2126181 RepID=A0A8H6VWG6_9AGAR|nr:uncharacterized protein MIND_01166500 [Mycena indigotica]KAF7292683.1 hypothetical protein MIND_01166500 [Mycena indigotica]
MPSLTQTALWLFVFAWHTAIAVAARVPANVSVGLHDTRLAFTGTWTVKDGLATSLDQNAKVVLSFHGIAAYISFPKGFHSKLAIQVGLDDKPLVSVVGEAQLAWGRLEEGNHTVVLSRLLDGDNNSIMALGSFLITTLINPLPPAVHAAYYDSSLPSSASPSPSPSPATAAPINILPILTKCIAGAFVLAGCTLLCYWVNTRKLRARAKERAEVGRRRQAERAAVREIRGMMLAAAAGMPVVETVPAGRRGSDGSEVTVIEPAVLSEPKNPVERSVPTKPAPAMKRAGSITPPKRVRWAWEGPDSISDEEEGDVVVVQRVQPPAPVLLGPVPDERVV